MKKKFFAILFFVSIGATAQNSYTFQAQDWAYLIGKNANSIINDSTSNTEYRKIRDQIRTANPASWTTNVTVTGVPDWVGLAFYRTIKTSSAGEIATRYTAITSQIEGKASLATEIAAFNARILADFERSRDLGKYITMDQ
jgi:hypothetical protein